MVKDTVDPEIRPSRGCRWPQSPIQTLTALPTATSRVGEASGVLSETTPLRGEHREGKEKEKDSG